MIQEGWLAPSDIAEDLAVKGLVKITFNGPNLNLPLQRELLALLSCHILTGMLRGLHYSLWCYRL